MHRSFVVVLFALSAVLYAGPAGAPPPIASFPSEVRPTGTGAVPTNARVWIFGKDAPPLAQLGTSLTVDGAPADFEVRALGCCLVVVAPAAEVTVGSALRVVVTHAGGDVDLEVVPDTPADHAAPTLSPPAVLEESPDALVLGVEGGDDVALAGFLARDGDDVLGAAPPGFALEVALDAARCADVVAVDLAGNESAPRQVCATLVSDDAGPPLDGGDEQPTAPSCACAAGGTTSTVPLGLALVLVGRALLRRRRR